MKLREIEFVETDRENSYEVYVGDFRVGYFTYMPMLDSYSFIPNFELVYNLQRVNYNSKESFVNTLSEYLEKQYEQSDLFRNILFDCKKELFFEEICIETFFEDIIRLNENKTLNPRLIGKNVKMTKENNLIEIYFEEIYQKDVVEEYFEYRIYGDFTTKKLLKKLDYEYDKKLIYHKPLNKFLHKITFGLVDLIEYFPKDAIIKTIYHKNATFTPKFLIINGETF